MGWFQRSLFHINMTISRLSGLWSFKHYRFIQFSDLNRRMKKAICSFGYGQSNRPRMNDFTMPKIAQLKRYIVGAIDGELLQLAHKECKLFGGSFYVKVVQPSRPVTMYTTYQATPMVWMVHYPMCPPMTVTLSTAPAKLYCGWCKNDDYLVFVLEVRMQGTDEVSTYPIRGSMFPDLFTRNGFGIG